MYNIPSLFQPASIIAMHKSLPTNPEGRTLFTTKKENGDLCNLKCPCNPKGNRCTIGPGDIELAYRELEGHVGPSVHRLPSGLQLDSVLKPIWMQSTIPMQSRHQSVYERAREYRTRGADFVHSQTQSRGITTQSIVSGLWAPF